MRRRFLTLVGALLCLSGTALAEPEIPYRDYGATTGEYKQEYAPDEIYLRVTIRERDSKGKISIEEQQQQMADALTLRGIDVSKVLKLKELSSAYTKKGNLAFGRYELKLSTPEEFYAAYTACDSLGLSDVGLDRIDRSDKELLRDAAAAEAMKAARRKAEAIAAAAGRNVGKCFYFADEVSVRTDSNLLMGMVAGVSTQSFKGGADERSPFLPEVGTVSIRASVEAKFELE